MPRPQIQQPPAVAPPPAHADVLAALEERLVRRLRPAGADAAGLNEQLRQLESRLNARLDALLSQPAIRLRPVEAPRQDPSPAIPDPGAALTPDAGSQAIQLRNLSPDNLLLGGLALLFLITFVIWRRKRRRQPQA